MVAVAGDDWEVVVGAYGRPIATIDKLTYEQNHNGTIDGTLEFSFIDSAEEEKLVKPFRIDMYAPVKDKEGHYWHAQITEVEISLSGSTPNEPEKSIRYVFSAQSVTGWKILTNKPSGAPGGTEGKVYNPYTGRWTWF